MIGHRRAASCRQARSAPFCTFTEGATDVVQTQAVQTPGDAVLGRPAARVHVGRPDDCSDRSKLCSDGEPSRHNHRPAGNCDDRHHRHPRVHRGGQRGRSPGELRRAVCRRASRVGWGDTSRAGNLQDSHGRYDDRGGEGLHRPRPQPRYQLSIPGGRVPGHAERERSVRLALERRLGGDANWHRGQGDQPGGRRGGRFLRHAVVYGSWKRRGATGQLRCAVRCRHDFLVFRHHRDAGQLRDTGCRHCHRGESDVHDPGTETRYQLSVSAGGIPRHVERQRGVRRPFEHRQRFNRLHGADQSGCSSESIGSSRKRLLCYAVIYGSDRWRRSRGEL